MKMAPPGNATSETFAGFGAGAGFGCQDPLEPEYELPEDEPPEDEPPEDEPPEYEPPE